MVEHVLKNEMMRIFINDEALECEQGATVKQLLEKRGVETNHVAVAVGNDVLPREKWATTVIEEGWRVVIIKAAQGG
jgi:thiamine biosynthesis protein ThiS